MYTAFIRRLPKIDPMKKSKFNEVFTFDSIKNSPSYAKIVLDIMKIEKTPSAIAALMLGIDLMSKQL